MDPAFRLRWCILLIMVPWRNSGQERHLKGLDWAERYSDHPTSLERQLNVLPLILQYLIPWARIGTGNLVAQDEKLAGELWRWLEEQVESI